ncbi:hypothetical protein REPUB_Repub12eG0192100 [Reevesia pubescens]
MNPSPVLPNRRILSAKKNEQSPLTHGQASQAQARRPLASKLRAFVRHLKLCLSIDMNLRRIYGISPSNIPNPLQKIICKFEPQAQSPSISRTKLTRFYLVSVVSLVGARRVNSPGFIVGTRCYHSNPNSQTQRMSRAFSQVLECAKQSLGRAFLWASTRKWTISEVVVDPGFLSVLGGKIERVPYSKRFHYVLSDKHEKEFSQIQWRRFEKENRGQILPPSDPRVIRVESIVRKILQAMNKGLMLKHPCKINIAQTYETSRLPSDMARNLSANEDLEVNGDSGCREMIQQSLNRKLIWKPATKHLDGKVWEVYVTGNSAQTSKSSGLSNDMAQNFGELEVNVDSGCQEKVQQSRNPKLIWKPATKHLDGKVWEVYVADSDLVKAQCFLDGKIIIHTGLLLLLESDAELATAIAHEIGHAVARHVAEVFRIGLAIISLKMILANGGANSSESREPNGRGLKLVKIVESLFRRRYC